MAQSPTVTPTYQSVLNNALNDVRVKIALGNMYSWEAWDSLEALYCLVPAPVREECTQMHDEIIKGLKDIMNSKSVDLIFGDVKTRNQIRRFLYLRNRDFFTALIDALYKHGYLEKLWHPVNEDDFADLEKADEDVNL